MQGTIQNATEVEAGDTVEHVEYDQRYEVVRVDESDGSMSVRKSDRFSNNKTVKKTALGLFKVVA